MRARKVGSLFITRIMGCLLALWLGISIWVLAIQARHYWQDRWIQDDAYISFRYAKNFIRGQGLVFNPGDRVEGYTNFTWVMLSAIPQVFGAEDPIEFMHQVSLALWIGTYLTLLVLGWKVVPCGAWVAPVLLVALSFNYSFNQWFLSGMETPLITFLSTLLVLLVVSAHKALLTVVTGVVAALLLMSRMDTVFFVVGAVTSLLFFHYYEQKRIHAWFLLALGSPLLLIYGSYFVWRLFYYGGVFPNTYYAKLGYETFYGRGLTYLKTLYTAYPYLLSALVSVVAFFPPRTQVRTRSVVTALLCSLLTFFYVVRLGGDFMEWRFVTPIFGLLYLLAFVGITSFAAMLSSWITARPTFRSAMTATLALACCTWTTYLLYVDRETLAERARAHVMEGQENIPSLRKYAEPPFLWREIGKKMKEVLPPDLMYATSAAGMIPFFSEHPVIDTLGLTDKAIAMGKEGKLAGQEAQRERVGHEFVETNLEVLRARGVDFLLEWPGLEPKHVVGAYTIQPNAAVRVVSLNLNTNSWVDLLALKPSNPVWRQLERDDRIELYEERSKGIIEVNLARLTARVANDTNWNDPRCLQISTEIQIHLPAPQRVRGLEISLDHNDSYTVLLMQNEAIGAQFEISPFPYPNNGGVKNRAIDLQEEVNAVTKVIVRPHDADWQYGICHLILH